MSIVASDWSINRSTGAIRYIGDDHGGAAPSYVSGIEWFRWLGSLSDDESSVGDDELAITDELHGERQTDNIIRLSGIYNIDDTAAEHIFDCSIIQNGGDTIYDGIVNFGNADVQIQIIQNGAVLADDWWNQGGAGLNASAEQGISHRFMLKVRDGGVDIDGRRLIGQCRTFGKTYSEFRINGTARGNNVLALNDSGDLNNETAEGTVSGWTTITNTEGYRGIDINDDQSDEYYYSEWNRDAYTINQLYERAKWLTRSGSASTIYGISGELFRGITHEITIDNPTGTFDAVEPVSWSGGTGQMLAINSTTAGTMMWIQLLTGVAPTDGQTITGSTSSATADVNVTVTDRSATLKYPFIGQSTGSAIIGAYGVGIEKADLSANDKVTDLTNTVINPPNAVTFTVSGLASGEDRVLVAPWDGATLDNEGNPAIDKSQLTLATTLNGAAETSVECTALIPSDTPSSGTIRITLDNGSDLRVPYTSYSGSTFTIASTDFSTANATAGNGLYASYIDELASGTVASFNSIFNSPRDLVVIVRDGGATPIKQFISPATLGSNGGAVAAIRTSDL